MAASITLASPVIAADGKTLTATISGGTGTGYAITNNTGITPHLTSGDANGFIVSSVSVAGSTLTVNLASSVGTGEAMRLDIATNSNLTDSGANTPTGQSNITCTNNSTVTVTTVLMSTNPEKFEINGAIVLSGGKLRNVSGTWGSGIDNYLVEFIADASEVTLISYVAATSVARVDGGAEATLLGNNFWSFKPIASGLAAGKHLFHVNTDYFTGVRLVGGNRTMHVVPTTKVTMLGGTAYTSIPSATPVTAWGTWKASTIPSEVSVSNTYNGFNFDCQISGTGIEVATIASTGSQWSTSVDGGYEGAQVITGVAAMNNTAELVPLAWGLSSGTHTIHAQNIAVGTGTTHKGVKVLNGTKTTASSIVGATTLSVSSTANLAVDDWIKIDGYGKREWRQITAISGSGPYTITVAALSQAHVAGVPVTSYTATAGTITTWVKKDLSLKRIVVMGDSNFQGWNTYGQNLTPDANGVYYAPYDYRTTGAFYAAQLLNMDMVDVAIQGTTSANQAGRAADIPGFSRSSYDYVLIWEGTNDINGGGITPAQYKTNVQTQITAAAPYLRANGKIILLPPGTPSTTSAQGLNIAACRTALQQLADENPTTCIYAGTMLDTLVPADYNGLHYEASGQLKIGQQLVRILSGLPSGAGMFFAA